MRGRTAFRRLPTHCSPNTSRFMAEFRLKASTDMAHHAALAPNSPDGSRPPAKSLFRTLWTSSPLPHLCLDHQINSSADVPQDLPSLCWTAPRGEWKLLAPIPNEDYSGLFS